MSGPNEHLTRRDFLACVASGAAAGQLAMTSAALAGDTAGKPPLLPSGVLGRTRYPVTLVSFGAILITEPVGTRVVKAGIDAGINLLHTSASYMKGKSVPAIGKLFKVDKTCRDKVFLCLKSFTPDKDSELEEMLAGLGTDHADVLLSTMDAPDSARLDVIRKAQESLKKRGKIRHTGFVCHGDMNGVCEMVLEKAPDYFDVCLLSTAMLKESGERKSAEAGEKADRFKRNLKALRDKGVGILSMKSGARKAVKEGAAVFGPHAKAVLAAGVDSVLTSIDTLDQVGMVKTLKLDTARSPAEARAAADFGRGRPNACLMCGDCSKACPNGVPVADLMRIRMYRDEYGWHDHARAECQALGGHLPALVARCDDCMVCGKICPAGLANRLLVQDVVASFA
jgi:predicted aldo/keto reductase-like oxidoreductase